MNTGRFIIEINVFLNDISDNIYSDHKAVQSNLTELFFVNLMNKLISFFPDFPQEFNFNILTHVIYYTPLQTHWWTNFLVLI